MRSAQSLRRAASRLTLAVAALVAAVVLAAAGVLVAARPALAAQKLPAATLHGPIDRLLQYPLPELASARERQAATTLLAQIRAAVARYEDPAAARADGYPTRRRVRDPGDRSVGWLHAEREPGAPYFDPARPKAIVYASVPGEPLVLVGVMFSLPRGMRGATPGGPVTRWHTHYVCQRGGERGTAALAGGRCPEGSVKREGSEMMHVWLTDDLASAFALHAPAPELCRVGRVPQAGCGDWPRSRAPRWPGVGWSAAAAAGSASAPPGRDGTAIRLSLTDPAPGQRPALLALCSLHPFTSAAAAWPGAAASA